MIVAGDEGRRRRRWHRGKQRCLHGGLPADGDHHRGWSASLLVERGEGSALCTTFEGVVAMHRMMSGDEPGLLREGQGSDGSPTEASLKQMMRDPRYWRQQDPAIVEQVREGFRRLYQGRG